MTGPGPVRSRRRQAGVLTASGLGGLCFWPVFGPALAGPVAAVCLACFVVLEATRRWPRAAAWRPLLVPAGGLLAIVETMLGFTTVAGVPTPATVEALGAGLGSWRRTLESTWPARPDPALTLFVPLLVLLACLLAVELLDRIGGLTAMLPSLGVLVLSQAYAPVSGRAAYLVALGYAAVAALVLAPVTRRQEATGSPSRTGPRPGRRPGPRLEWDRGWLLGAVALAVAGLAGGLLVVDLDPAGRKPYTLQPAQASVPRAPRITSPLDDVSRRLTDPETVAFRYRADGPVDRWRLVALEGFDGSNWTTERPLLRFGTELAPGDAVSVPTAVQSGVVEVRTLPGPWLPSRPLPRTVTGAGKVFVEPDGGTLIAPERPDRYTLTWATRQVTAAGLLGAAVDGDVPVGDLGRVPGEIAELAADAIGGRATFQTALALERYLATRYELAGTGTRSGGPPTGHGWPQLRRFLLEDKRGTSEQFAAAYVVLARLNGIPARLVVGFRTPAADEDGWTTVRNGDVLVWPEVAVDGIGWWPLDPAGLADPARPVGGDREVVTEQARAELPPADQITDPAVPPNEDTEAEADPGRDGVAPGGSGTWWLLLLLPPVGWLAGVPSVRWLRARRRRRRSGSAAVAGAWAEARDRLRAHGVPVTAGMTVRDLAAVAAPIVGRQAQTLGGLERLAQAVDGALWSSAPPTGQLVDQAWAGVHEVVSGLRARPWPARLRAALHVRSLW